MNQNPANEPEKADETVDWLKRRRTRKRRMLPKILLIILVAIPVAGFVVMLLWNWLMPVVFGLHAIDFWQALGLLALSRILFGGFRGRGPGGRRWRNRRMVLWEKMTPEERNRLVEGMRAHARCGANPPAATAE